MKSALWSARQEQPARLVCALPVAPGETAVELAEFCDSLLLLRQPDMFYAVGQFYMSFNQVTDDEVLDILRHEAGKRRPSVR